MIRPLILFSLVACGSPAGPAQKGVEVRIEYRAATALDPTVASSQPDCVNVVGETHIHPSWASFAIVRMLAEGNDLWTKTFVDVPIGPQRIRISDPNVCRSHPTGAVQAKRIYANGVQLIDAADTPGELEGDTEPGFGFTVRADGSIGN